MNSFCLQMGWLTAKTNPWSCWWSLWNPCYQSDDEGDFWLESFKPSFTCLLTKSAHGTVRHHNMVFTRLSIIIIESLLFDHNILTPQVMMIIPGMSGDVGALRHVKILTWVALFFCGSCICCFSYVDTLPNWSDTEWQCSVGQSEEEKS